jgi:DNA modification methylase
LAIPATRTSVRGSPRQRPAPSDPLAGFQVISVGRFWVSTEVFWYGDNLEVMREHMGGDREVDLIYLDPPFNSKRAYNMFFKEADDSVSQAQRTSFEDYWRWKGGQAAEAYGEITMPGRRRHLVPAKLVETMQMLMGILGETDMMAYLAMMAVRLVEMKRLLKDEGSLYLHCDPTGLTRFRRHPGYAALLIS